jgi:copper chaperone CopZ
LSQLGGVNSVSVDLASRKVVVSFDPGKISENDLKGAIVEAGYDVEA